MKFDLQKLGKATFLDPKEAARTLMALRRSVSTEALWMAVILAAILNALMLSASYALFPPPPEAEEIIPPAFRSPGLLAVFVTGGLVISVFVLFWAGKALGGKAALADVLAVLTWLELVQAAIQGALLVLALALPPLAQLASFVLSVWMLYILIAFLDTVHGFGSPLRAVGVLILSFGLLVVGLLFFLLLIGALAEGAT